MVEKIDKISIVIGDKKLAAIDLEKGFSENEQEELIWNAILSTVILYKKGQIAQINFGDYKKRFRVKKSFVFHGFKSNKVIVTIPVTLDTMKGLGFIGSIKKSEHKEVRRKK